MLKKLVYRVLCNNLTGSVIYSVFKKGIPDIRWSGFKFKIPRSSVNKEMAASVFWGFYESSEIRYVEKYLRKDLNVIELGSSLGIVSSHISSSLGNGQHFITVEANPYLIDTIRTNIEKHKNPSSTFEILNNAVGYNSEEVMISITDNNTETRVVRNDVAGATVAVKTISLSDLTKKLNSENYVLVCDIEGSEIEILLNETETLKKCSQLCIELHDTVYNDKKYSISMLKEMLLNHHGFKVLQEHGPVVLYTR